MGCPDCEIRAPESLRVSIHQEEEFFSPFFFVTPLIGYILYINTHIRLPPNISNTCILHQYQNSRCVTSGSYIYKVYFCLPPSVFVRSLLLCVLCAMFSLFFTSKSKWMHLLCNIKCWIIYGPLRGFERQIKGCSTKNTPPPHHTTKPPCLSPGYGVMACQEMHWEGRETIKSAHIRPDLLTCTALCWPVSGEEARCRCPTPSSSDLPALTQNPPDLPPWFPVCVCFLWPHPWQWVWPWLRRWSQCVCDMMTFGTVGSPAL